MNKQMTTKIKMLLKDKRFLYIILALIAIVLILIPSFVKDKKVNSSYDNSYGEYLERKLEDTLGTVLGDGSIDVMITFENAITAVSNNEKDSFNLFNESKDSIDYNRQPLPKIAGVMIVCKSIHSANDLDTIKKATSVALNVSETKIKIIGGKSK